MWLRPLMPMSLALMAGIITGAHLAAAAPPLAATTAGAAAVAAAVVFGCDRRLIRGAVLLGMWVVGMSAIEPWVRPVFPDGHIVWQVDRGPQTITGRVVDMPRHGEQRVTMIVEAAERRSAGSWAAAAGRIRVTVGGDPVTAPVTGDRVCFTARLRPMGGFLNPGGFDFGRSMAYRGVWVGCWVPVERFEVTAPAIGAASRWHPDHLRSVVGRWLSDAVDGDSAAVLQSLVIGDRRHLSSKLRETFNRLGISHLLAISGLHLGIIALVGYRLSRWGMVRIPALVWRGWADRAAVAVSFPPLVVYALLAGMSPATQRALLMALVVVGGAVAGRRHDLFNTLALAALAILLCHPPSLFDVSFQFSFAAVAGIIAGMPLMRPAGPAPVAEPAQGFFRLVLGMKTSMMVSLLANLATVPLAMTHFQQTSLVGCFTNLVFVPLFGFLVIPLALAGTLMMALLPPVGVVLLSAAAGLVTAGLMAAEAMAGIPGIALSTFVPTVLELGVYYACGAGLLYGWSRHREGSAVAGSDRPAIGGRRGWQAYRRWTLAILALAVMVAGDGLYWMHRRFWHKDLRITFLDVGQGNAAVVSFPGGATMLVDGGGSAMPGAFDVGAGVVAPFLRRERIFSIDILVLTHANSDHLNGLIAVADQFSVGVLWTNGVPAQTRGYRQFMKVLSGKRVPQPPYSAVFGIHRVGGSEIAVLYPPPDFHTRKPAMAESDRNDHSLVMRIVHDGSSVLLVGDITAPAERSLVALQGSRVAADVLLAPHHGSRSSSSPVFLNAVAPRAVVVSAGRRNRFGFPHPEVVARYRRAGAAVWRIDSGGAVSLSMAQGRWYCRQERAAP